MKEERLEIGDEVVVYDKFYEVLGVHPKSDLVWVKPLDGSNGEHLFHKSRVEPAKQPLSPGDKVCLRCNRDIVYEVTGSSSRSGFILCYSEVSRVEMLFDPKRLLKVKTLTEGRET